MNKIGGNQLIFKFKNFNFKGQIHKHGVNHIPKEFTQAMGVVISMQGVTILNMEDAMNAICMILCVAIYNAWLDMWKYV